jgi:hypothetical protein
MTESIKLPVGIESFDEIRSDGYYYVDKTKLIEAGEKSTFLPDRVVLARLST